MQPQEYSEKVQIEILDEVITNQGTTKTVDRTEPIREWNHNFLVTQGYIEEEYASSNVFRRASESGLLVDEKITGIGKIWRSYLYQKNEKRKTYCQILEKDTLDSTYTYCFSIISDSTGRSSRSLVGNTSSSTITLGIMNVQIC